jgi:hypothetical protein
MIKSPSFDQFQRRTLSFMMLLVVRHIELLSGIDGFHRC